MCVDQDMERKIDIGNGMVRVEIIMANNTIVSSKKSWKTAIPNPQECSIQKGEKKFGAKMKTPIVKQQQIKN